MGAVGDSRVEDWGRYLVLVERRERCSEGFVVGEKRHPLVENLLSFAGEIGKKIAVDVVEDLEDIEV